MLPTLERSYNQPDMTNPGTSEGSEGRGRLKVFLGYASGVGKSFRMFDEGRRRLQRGQDVVAGALQPDVPAEVKPLVASLEIVPMATVAGLPMMDVPAILARRPQICLVDGLAYDNPVASRHAYRWQDVEQLLAAGIHVIGSVNLQYIDDQQEAVEQITGKRVTQTIPRSFLNTADEIVIVDSPCEGGTAALSELRERALLLSADVIDAGLQRYLHAYGIEPARAAKERLLIYLTPRTKVQSLLAAANKTARHFHCDVLAVYVKEEEASAADRQALENAIAEAKAAGATTHALETDDAAEAIVQYARTNGVTQILVGSEKTRRWRPPWSETPLQELMRAARRIDLRVIPQ